MIPFNIYIVILKAINCFEIIMIGLGTLYINITN